MEGDLTNKMNTPAARGGMGREESTNYDDLKRAIYEVVQGNGPGKQKAVRFLIDDNPMFPCNGEDELFDVPECTEYIAWARELMEEEDGRPFAGGYDKHIIYEELICGIRSHLRLYVATELKTSYLSCNVFGRNNPAFIRFTQLLEYYNEASKPDLNILSRLKQISMTAVDPKVAELFEEAELLGEARLFDIFTFHLHRLFGECETHVTHGRG